MAVAPLARPGSRVAEGDGEALRRRMREAVGGDRTVLVDPTGAQVSVGQEIVKHILEDPERIKSGRECWFPLIPELIERPQEI